MKKFILILFAVVAVIELQAQDIAGSFMGTIPNGGSELHLVFNIKKAADNTLSATFDSPDQKAFGIPCGKTTFVKDSLVIAIPVINGSYEGVLTNKDVVTGTYKQGPATIPLALKRISEADKESLSKPSAAKAEQVRPQTPKPPFDYSSEDVEYDNADKSVHYGATFTKPKGDGKFPAVIIISGSGTQDRDGTLFGHKLYWVLADYLTAHGIAVLRVDDRGAGKSTLGPDFKNATSLTFSFDVEASLNYLETRADVNKKHVGLIGHSEGGIIAPMVAARRRDVSFIVMWGGPEVGGAKTLTEQNVYPLKKAGTESAATNGLDSLFSRMFALFPSAKSKADLDEKIIPVFDSWKNQQTAATLKTLNATNLAGKDMQLQFNRFYDNAWLRYFVSYEPKVDLAKVKCPVLAINGAKDIQVLPEENLALIKQVLNKNGNKDVEVKELPGLNHLLQTATTGDVSEYEKIDETMSPVAMNIICSWIKLHSK